MNFGQAIDALKAGKRVSRLGWNGKGMWLELWKPGRGLGYEAGGHPISPCIAMKTAGNDYQPGWLASQADILAEDWGIVD